MADLPELHGWLPTGAMAQRLGISPTTVRRRGREGLLEVAPNPLGRGALYRENPPMRPDLRAGGGSAGQTPNELRLVAIHGLSREDRLTLGQLPSSAPRIARALGLPRSTVYRQLRRLERWGFARRCPPRPSGRRGGRPEVPWRPVA